MSIIPSTPLAVSNKENFSHELCLEKISPTQVQRVYVAHALYQLSLGKRASSTANLQILSPKINRVIESPSIPLADQRANLLVPENSAIDRHIRPRVVPTTDQWDVNDVVLVNRNCYVFSDLSSKDDETIIGTRNLGNHLAIIALGYRFFRTYPGVRPRVNGLAICDDSLGSVIEAVENLKNALFATYGSPKTELEFVIVGPAKLLKQKKDEIRSARTNLKVGNYIAPLSNIPEQTIDLVVDGNNIYYGPQIIEGEN